VGAAEALGGLLHYPHHDTIRVREHVRIPKANDLPAFTFKIGGAPLVRIGVLKVLTAIEFHPQPGGSTGKVDDEGRNDQLPGKGGSID